MSTVVTSGVGYGGARDASTLPKLLICQKFGQNPEKFRHLILTLFNNNNEISRFC